MAKNITDEVAYYYDFHPTEEDLMGETSVHADLVHYLVEVLKWLFRGHPRAVHENLNFYQTSDTNEHPLAPGIAVIKGVSLQRVRSWRVGKTGPAPQVVFEIASEETWKKDLDEKPMKYMLMGVQEYFAYDPNMPALRRSASGRLFGWHLNKREQVIRQMPVDADGRLWSFHLESFLVPDMDALRLYDGNGLVRLTRAESEAEAKYAETRRADAEARRAETRRADAETEARRAETRRADALAEKLRALGIDPDQV